MAIIAMIWQGYIAQNQASGTMRVIHIIERPGVHCFSIQAACLQLRTVAYLLLLQTIHFVLGMGPTPLAGNS